ncbi:MAG TPA: enoyl-CoA hydratase-related protein [Ignavibacteriaceae bacterium]|nr:enoyl-CoA hydratase-related protein [Ignavibacteriaceae bacterium]
MSYKNLNLELKDAVVLIRINRPEKLNALDSETIGELKKIFTEIEKNDQIKAVLLTGAGEKAFAAGADILELSRLNMVEGKVFAEKGQEVFDLIENFPKPVIAAVNGYALGGGCELALACHFRIASENARFGQPELNIGIIPGFGGTQRLTRLINSGRAMEYILTCDSIDASEALRIGLVNKIYKQDELISKSTEIAAKIASKPSNAARSAIKAINAADEMPAKTGMKFEAGLFALCCGTEDFKEGTSAFLEKRKPNFKDK